MYKRWADEEIDCQVWKSGPDNQWLLQGKTTRLKVISSKTFLFPISIYLFDI